MCVCFFTIEAGERDYLPSQEARMKAGLEKALEHKDKLLEYDKNRYYKTHISMPNHCSQKEFRNNF